ncbi:hypothetical protein ENTB45_014 [Enterobacter phage Entb_45]|nr:hypothetical protein ENTB45_014 [Enterobacter phage Entb_45]
MQVNLSVVLLIGALFGGALFIQTKINDSLRESLDNMIQVSKTQAEQIKTLQDDFKGLQNIDKNRSERRQDQVKSDQKLDKDSKRADVVAKKPGLVENQINASFNKFAQGLQEATK